MQTAFGYVFKTIRLEERHSLQETSLLCKQGLFSPDHMIHAVGFGRAAQSILYSVSSFIILLDKDRCFDPGLPHPGQQC